MAKRYTDNDKWDDPFFTELPNEYKLLWLYILDKCDHAGIYKVNPKNAHFALNTVFDWKEVVKVLDGRITILSQDKWFIPKFLNFQYGALDPANRVHQSVITILEKEGAFKGLARPTHQAKDKDKDKDIDKDKIFIQALKDNPAYRHIDLNVELGKMDAWLLTHRGRQKTKPFILRWLNKIDKPLPSEVKVERVRKADPKCQDCKGTGRLSMGNGKTGECVCVK